MFLMIGRGLKRRKKVGFSLDFLNQAIRVRPRTRNLFSVPISKLKCEMGLLILLLTTVVPSGLDR